MGPLVGIKVLDLSRVLAGPWASQVLADMGASVIKVERPECGDDTRKWGPPFIKNDRGEITQESAYFQSANRGKQSITVDFTTEQGREILLRLLEDADILIENYKVGTLVKYALDYDSLKQDFPGLIYASITGFGQSGPRANQPGYDFMIQGMSGMMSVTGEAVGMPMKTGVAIADLFTGVYTSSAILGALYHREKTGEDQAIDMALLDTAVATMSYQAQNYFAAEEPPNRMGNTHPNLVPYQVFQVSDGHVVVAVDNDAQFAQFAECLGHKDWAEGPKYKTGEARVENRNDLITQISDIMQSEIQSHWLEKLQARGIPCGPINSLSDVFEDRQIKHREMKMQLDHPHHGPVDLVKSPINYSETVQEYKLAPPRLGADTDSILNSLGYSVDEIKVLRKVNAV